MRHTSAIDLLVNLPTQPVHISVALLAESWLPNYDRRLALVRIMAEGLMSDLRAVQTFLETYQRSALVKKFEEVVESLCKMLATRIRAVDLTPTDATNVLGLISEGCWPRAQALALGTVLEESVTASLARGGCMKCKQTQVCLNFEKWVSKSVRSHCEFLPGVQRSKVEAFAHLFVNLGLRNPSELTIRSAVAVLILMCVPIKEAVAMDMEAKRATVVELKGHIKSIAKFKARVGQTMYEYPDSPAALRLTRPDLYQAAYGDEDPAGMDRTSDVLRVEATIRLRQPKGNNTTNAQLVTLLQQAATGMGFVANPLTAASPIQMLSALGDRCRHPATRPSAQLALLPP